MLDRFPEGWDPIENRVLHGRLRDDCRFDDGDRAIALMNSAIEVGR
jgi:hypothetical protein